jgi:predicted transcriptional regulator
MSDKEMVIEVVRQLPERVSIEEIIEEIAMLAAIQRGERDAESGRVVSHDEVKKRLGPRKVPYFLLGGR